MKKINIFFTLLFSFASMQIWAEPGNPCSTIVENDTVYTCPGEEVIINHGIFHQFTPTQDTIVYDTLLTVEHNCDSVIKTFVSIMPTYEYIDTLYIPVGQTSIQVYGMERTEGMYIETFKSIYNCDSIHRYWVRRTWKYHLDTIETPFNITRDTIYFEVTDDQAIIIGIGRENGWGRENIPDTTYIPMYVHDETSFEKYPVVSIADSALQALPITHITIPGTIQSIGLGAFINCTKLTSIILPNSVNLIKDYTFKGCTSLKHVGIPNSVTRICSNAFKDCPLTSLFLPASLTRIGSSAFLCDSLTAVYCPAIEPPTWWVDRLAPFYFLKDDGGAKTKVDTLFVPTNSINTYNESQWTDYFTYIIGISFGESEVENITESSAVIKWLHDTAVTQYDIKIYQQETLFAQYIVGGDGQIVSSQQFAQTIHKMRMDTTNSSTDYYVLTLDDLEAGTEYNYSIDGTDANNAPVYHEEGSFMTKTTDGIEPVVTDDKKKVRKIFRDGQIFILRENKTYTIMGLSL